MEAHYARKTCHGLVFRSKHSYVLRTTGYIQQQPLLGAGQGAARERFTPANAARPILVCRVDVPSLRWRCALGEVFVIDQFSGATTAAIALWATP